MQVPSNIFLNYIGRPSLYLPACMVAWGTIRWVEINRSPRCPPGSEYPQRRNRHHAQFHWRVLRFFLGFVEGTFFPGALFLLSKWYVSRTLI